MNTKARKYFFFLLGILIPSYGIGFFLDKSTMVYLVTEDGIVEWIGSLSFLIASIIFYLLYRKSNSGNDLILFRTKKNIFFLLLALLFFFTFGEELSWGQRIFGLNTPEYFQSRNIQNEINLHNLDIFNSVDEQNVKRPWYDIFSMSRLFRVFWFLFCFGIPVLDKFNAPFSRLRKRINVPLIPIWLGALFPINYLISKVMMIMVSKEIRFVEIEETMHAVFFGIAAFWLYREFKRSGLIDPIINKQPT